MDTHPTPVELRLHSQSRVLEIAYDDGARFRLPCEYLRVYSPSAEVRGHSPATAKLQVGKEQVRITDLQQIGRYAVKAVTQSDIHAVVAVVFVVGVVFLLANLVVDLLLYLLNPRRRRAAP